MAGDTCLGEAHCHQDIGHGQPWPHEWSPWFCSSLNIAIVPYCPVVVNLTPETGPAIIGHCPVIVTHRVMTTRHWCLVTMSLVTACCHMSCNAIIAPTEPVTTLAAYWWITIRHRSAEDNLGFNIFLETSTHVLRVLLIRVVYHLNFTGRLCHWIIWAI